MVEREQSEFNYALAYLERINHTFYFISQNYLSDNYYGWMKGLSLLYREVSTKMKQKERDAFENQLKSLYSKVHDYENQKMRTGKSIMNAQTHWELVEFENKIRSIIKESGIEGRTAEKAAEALR